MHFAIQLPLRLGLSLLSLTFALRQLPEFTQLRQALEDYGFTVTLPMPPQSGAIEQVS